MVLALPHHRGPFLGHARTLARTRLLEQVVSQSLGLLGILAFPCFAVPHLPFGGSIGKCGCRPIQNRGFGPSGLFLTGVSCMSDIVHAFFAGRDRAEKPLNKDEQQADQFQ